MSHDHSDNGHGDATKLQHHFDNVQQQFSASKLGMWLFLAQEVLFFGGLFCAYAVYRAIYPEVYRYAHQALNKNMGALNTVILLVSSLTMALAVRSAQTNNQKWLLRYLILTFLCAGGFMVVKFFEYSEKLHHGYFFAEKFDYQGLDHRLAEEAKLAHAAALESRELSIDQAAELEVSTIGMAAKGPGGVMEELEVDVHGAHGGHGELHGPRPPNVHIFFGLYFALTGLHGIHVLGGMVMLVWLYIGAVKGRFTSEYFTPVDLGGLYWHLVDLIWIYLFPLLYLIG